MAGSWWGSHKKIVGLIERCGQRLVPAVFMIIGAVIIIESGVVTRLLQPPTGGPGWGQTHS